MDHTGLQATHHLQPQQPRSRGSRPYTGAKRGRKPRGGGPVMTTPSTGPDPPQPVAQAYPTPVQATSQASQQPLPQSQAQLPLPSHPQPQPQLYYSQQAQQSTLMPLPQYPLLPGQKGRGKEESVPSRPTLSLSTIALNPNAIRYPTQQHQQTSHPVLALGHGSLSLHSTTQSHMRPPPSITAGVTTTGINGAAGGGADDEDDADELPVMSDDVYDLGLLWQSQSKDNLKVLMDNFTPEQFERYEAYRRSALPKQSVRKVIQQTTNYTISQPVAQVVAGFAKVFVGEIVEKARAVQARMGEPPDTPLSPEHLREAYRLYQEETGKVGAARVHRGKKLFVR